MAEQKVRLTYPPHQVGQPLLYRLIQQFGVVANIVEAQVSPQGACLVLALSGEAASLHVGLAWLAEQGVVVETLTAASGSEQA